MARMVLNFHSCFRSFVRLVLFKVFLLVASLQQETTTTKDPFSLHKLYGALRVFKTPHTRFNARRDLGNFSVTLRSFILQDSRTHWVTETVAWSTRRTGMQSVFSCVTAFELVRVVSARGGRLGVNSTWCSRIRNRRSNEDQYQASRRSSVLLGELKEDKGTPQGILHCDRVRRLFCSVCAAHVKVNAP